MPKLIVIAGVTQAQIEIALNQFRRVNPGFNFQVTEIEANVDMLVLSSVDVEVGSELIQQDFVNEEFLRYWPRPSEASQCQPFTFRQVYSDDYFGTTESWRRSAEEIFSALGIPADQVHVHEPNLQNLLGLRGTARVVPQERDVPGIGDIVEVTDAKDANQGREGPCISGGGADPATVDPVVWFEDQPVRYKPWQVRPTGRQADPGLVDRISRQGRPIRDGRREHEETVYTPDEKEGAD
jgi:hypothetical protein